MDNQIGGNKMTESVVRMLTKGHSFAKIASNLKVEQGLVIKVWQEYVENRYAMPWAEQYILQSERVENLLVVANDVLSMEMDADSIQATLKVLQEIDNLQNLALARREKVQLEQTELTKAQVGILMATISGIQSYMRDKIQGITYEQFQELQENFNQVFTDVSRKALEEVKQDV